MGETNDVWASLAGFTESLAGSYATVVQATGQSNTFPGTSGANPAAQVAGASPSPILDLNLSGLGNFGGMSVGVIVAAIVGFILLRKFL